MASLKKVGYVSDIEGNYDYWRKYVEYSDVLVVEGSNVLLRDNCHFVCGGDVCDRGAGDVRVLRELLALKKLHPQRVHFVLGNRDINKLRLPAALHPSVLSQTPDVYWFDNSSQPGGNDYSLDNRANRLKWILLFTMGSPLSFECRRKELEILGLPSDDDSVADSYLKLIMPGGELFEYIRLGCMAVLIEDTLYVHGGLPDDFVGFVPPTRGGISQYYTDVHEWVREVNKFARSELDDFQNNIDSFLNSLSSLDNAAVKIWDSESGYGHAQPGSRLIQCGMGSSGRDNGKNPTVIYTSYLLNGSPVWPSDRATEWLARGGVTKLVVGHQPMGDSPLILTSPGGLNVISADTCYSKGVQYLVSDLSRSISLPSPPVSSSVSSLPESKSSPSSTTEEKWTTYHSFATEHGVIPRDTSDPWIAVDTRASRCISEICIVLDDEDGPFHVCTDERHDFDATPKRTRVSVKGVLSEGSPYQFTYPEEAGADALVGKKTVDNWIVKARGIHFPSSETTSPEYVQLGMSRSRDFKAKVIPLTEVLKMPLVNSWEEPPK